VRETVRALDAGDPVAGARVSGLPRGAKTTGANGKVTFTAKKGATLKLKGSKPGYKSAEARVRM
jgi:hypothetical protein